MTEIDVPIFLHPHLFWIFEKKNTLKRHQLQCDLALEYDHLVYKEKEFIIGEVVAVKSNNIWRRAIIEDIVECSSFTYEVWLMDYGHLYHTNSVHKLQKNFKLLAPLVKQASLYNVVFIDEAFSLEESCINRLKKSVPNAGATVNALQFLKDYVLFFIRNKEVNGILFGDILYKKKLKKSLLTKTLIEKNLMVEDTELFAKIEESRIYDKDFNIQALRQCSKVHKDDRCTLDLSILFGEIFTRSTARGISLSGYSESENEECNNPKPRLTKSDLLKKLKRKLEIRKIYGESCTEEGTELEETVSREGSMAENSDVEHTAKSSKCKNVWNRRKQALNKDYAMSESELKQSPAESDSSSRGVQTPKNSNKLLALKLKCTKTQDNNMDCKSLSDMESLANSETPSSIDQNNSFQKDVSENHGVPKLLEAANSLFLPGGVRSMTQRSSKKSKTKSNSHLYFSDSSLSIDSKRPKISVKIDDTVSSTNDVTDVDNKAILRNRKETTPQGCSGISDPDWINTTKIGVQEEGSRMVVKPFCKCPDCQHWTTSEEWRKPENFSGECETKKLKIVRPPSLLLDGRREDIIKLASINYSAMTKIEKQATYKLLLHSMLLPTPISHVTEAPFHSIVHRCLKNLGYSSARKMQTYIWPAVFRGNNVCYIHRKKTGKTLAYLPPVCSFLLEKEERYNDLKKGGPIVTILGSSSKQCEEIYDLVSRLFDGSGVRRPRVVLASYPFQHINMSSVDMLITIPTVLIELLKKNATNMKRLCHLVFEDVDVLLDKFRDEIKATVDVVESMLSHRNTGQKVQMIMSGEHWTFKVENFLKKLREMPVVCIGDYFEAAIYGGMMLKLKFLESKAKGDAVVDTLTNKWKFLKSIIFCNSNDEIEFLKTTLDLASISCIGITSDLSQEEMFQQEANWEHTSGEGHKVLICTDQLLHTMLSITSAVLIIHYSLPEKWTSLIKRFNCLLEHCRSPLISDNNKLMCESYILTDELCENQIPRLLSLLKIYNVPLKEYDALLNNIISQQERIKVEDELPVCLSLKQFGYCHLEKCPKRHIFNCDLDTNPRLPSSGTVKFKILELVDVNYLRVNVIEHKDIEGQLTAFRSQNNLNDEKLTEFLYEQKQRAQCVMKGASYAFWDTEEFDDMFRECIIEEVSEDKISILVKESGRRMVVCKSKIYNLPEELKTTMEMDSSNTEMIIANLKPPYKDPNFSSRAYLKLASTIDHLKYDDNIFVANVCLQLGNTLWVDNVTEEINVFDKNLMKTDITKQLLEEKLAERNEDHLSKLYALCDDVGIKLPKYNVPSKKTVVSEAPQVSPQWAFLDVEDCNEVIFSSAVSPEEFHVRLEKFQSLLINLERDIDDIVKRQGSKRDFAIIPGRYYLARDQEENKFGRVLVKHVENGEALCFAVDYGDESVVKLEEIRYLPKHLIMKLPFQAIHCRLHGLKAIDGEWPDDATDVLYDKYALEEDSNVYRTLYAKCVYYEKGIFRGQSKFSILLKDAYSEKPIIINQLLVDCGWADVFPNVTFSDFDIPLKIKDSEYEVIPINEHNDEEFDEVKDIFDKTQMVASNEVGLADNMDYENDSDIMCFFGNSDEEQDQFFRFMDEMVRAAKEKREISSRQNNTLPAIEASPFVVDYYTPDVYWTQTKDSIQLVIKLPNVETYKVRVEKSRIFSFQTTLNEKKYVLNLMLHETVEKDVIHSLGGLEITIKLKKKEESEWPKLSRSKKRLRNVHYMLSKEDMQEDKKKLLLDIGDDMKIDWSSDEEGGPMFNVVSDMDSDMDLDLQDDSD